MPEWPESGADHPAEHPDRPQPAGRGLFRGRLVLLAWWGLMFLGTHVPVGESTGPSPIPDKLIHFVMYAGLGLLLPLWGGCRRPLTGGRVLRLYAVLAIYAVADELLQIPVGRTAEVLDVVADLAGGAAGLVLAVLWQRAQVQVPNSRSS